uniref:SUZ domain-containing protein n=1 Tax=Hyaloperonospora arabidopsidis (strain Emoy2) TaxID=559515 RepID=M4BNL4_HYAAE
MIHPSRDACDEWESAVLDVTPTHNQVALAPASSPVSTDVDEAAQVLQDLCILPPPAATDTGGHYPHDHESPDQYKLPVTPNIVTDDIKQDEQLDPVLVTGLENARERMTLLQFEDQIVRFLRHSREPHLHFPPLSSYHRLIVHRLAQRCGLEHQTADYSPLENSSARVVTLIKTAQSVVPRLLLIDLSTDRQSSTTTPVCAPKIMMRKRCAPRLGSHNGGGSGTDKAMPSLQDRERAYAEARARIFGAATSNTAAESVVPSLPSSSTHDGSGIAASNGNDVARYGSRQAAGPDDSRGFGRGGAREGGGDVASTSGSSLSKRRSNVNDMNDEYSRTVQPSAPNAASWKGSKVLWRNREQELNDPDFTRNHDAFRARSSGGAASGSGSGGDLSFYGDRFGGGVRFGHGELQERPHDRFYGYHHQQSGGAPSLHPPPLMPMVSPGHGRYHVGGPDYANNRVDTNLFQRSSHQQYHPQQQQQPFQLHQMNPPPSMVMGRSSYGYPSPRGRQLPPHAADPRTVVHSEFVDDDFPPLK